MNLTLLDIGFDVLLAFLLVATICYAVVLDKKLDALRSARAEIEGLSRGFAEAILKAESSVSGLKMHAVEAGSGLVSQIDKAEETIRELQLTVGRAEKTGDRILKASQGECRKRGLSAGKVQNQEDAPSLHKEGAPDVGTRNPQGVPEGQKNEKPSLTSRISPAAADLLKDLRGMR